MGLTPSSVQQRLVDHPKCKKFKKQQLLPGQDWLCQREWRQEALGSGSWRGCARCGWCPLLCHPHRSFPLLRPRGVHPYSTVGAAIPFPWEAGVDIPQEACSPLEVREAAGILLVVVGNGEDGVVEFVVTELLERHSGRDGGEHRDV